jgi:GDP/UDP-N,N'-diacetylbacillosamine 2-epimerase (hydrolysing)
MTYTKNNIAVLTGSRAEYSLLKPLLTIIRRNKAKHKLNIIITSTHLSKEYGYTKNEIKEDGFKIYDEIETLISSDTQLGMVKSMGLGFISLAESLNRLKPDLLVCLGDRYEMFAGAYVASVLGIPIAHIHGGELTYGAVDDKFRHAITKASSIHFPCTEIYKKRIIQMGEQKKNVFNYGALAVERVTNIKKFSLNKLNSIIGLNLKYGCILVTVHSETNSNLPTNQFINPIIGALEKFKDLPIVITYANADHGGSYINNLMEDFCKRNPNKSVIKKSLGFDLYSNIMLHSKLVLGNSSSGIIEAPILGVPTLNIGNRQKGRVSTNSIYHVNANTKNILFYIKKILKEKKAYQKHPYGKGNTASKIYKTIANYLNQVKPSKEKKFFDVDFSV